MFSFLQKVLGRTEVRSADVERPLKETTKDEAEFVLYQYYMDSTDAFEPVYRSFTISRCECGSCVFEAVRAENRAGVMRICRECQTKKFIADSWKEWTYEGAQQAKCRRCGGMYFFLGIALLHNIHHDVESVFVDSYCVSCGYVSKVAHWQVEEGDVDEASDYT